MKFDKEKAVSVIFSIKEKKDRIAFFSNIDEAKKFLKDNSFVFNIVHTESNEFIYTCCEHTASVMPISFPELNQKVFEKRKMKNFL